MKKELTSHDRMDGIVNAVPLEKLIDMAQEECAELIQALSKIKRAMDGTGQNPTVLSINDAWAQARGEYTDLDLAIDAINHGSFNAKHDSAHCIWVNDALYAQKMDRWYQRLVKSGAIKEGGADETY